MIIIKGEKVEFIMPENFSWEKKETDYLFSDIIYFQTKALTCINLTEFCVSNPLQPI